jgi:hypothetical protein
MAKSSTTRATTSLGFDTPLVISGPLRKPRQMLADQEYGGHTSIHDDSMAEKLGFRAGPIEGPTRDQCDDVLQGEGEVRPAKVDTIRLS